MKIQNNIKTKYYKPTFKRQNNYSNGNEDYILSVVNSNNLITKKYGTFTRSTGKFTVYDSVSKNYIGELKTRTFGLYSDLNPNEFHHYVLKGLMIETQKYSNLMHKSAEFKKPALYINHLQGDHIIIFNLNEIDSSKLKIENIPCRDKFTLKTTVKPCLLLNYTLGELYINQLETKN